MNRILRFSTLLSGAYTAYLIGNGIYQYVKGLRMEFLNRLSSALLDHLASIVIVLIFVGSSGVLLYEWYTKNLKRRRIFHSSIEIIKNPKGYQYLVEGDTCFHIPDPPTFEYLGSFFGFSWDDSKPMSPDDIKRKFTMGKQLPSILSHCPKQDVKK